MILIDYGCGFLIFQMSEGGLFIDMFNFLAFGKDYVGWNFEKTGNPVYLHVKKTKKPVPEDRPSKKPTLLAIGLCYNILDICYMIIEAIYVYVMSCFSCCFITRFCFD